MQHLALADSLILQGAISPAMDQLGIARRAKDGTFYDHAIIDARERDLKERFKDQLEAERLQEQKQKNAHWQLGGTPADTKNNPALPATNSPTPFLRDPTVRAN